MKEMEALSRRLMKYLALSLDLPADYFDDTFGTCPNIQLKVCHYPATSITEKGEFNAEDEDGDDDDSTRAMFGVGPHTDSGYLSLLLQDDVGGLQVQNQRGEWVDAPPIDGTIVVNLGEMLQLATSGYFLATPHRVLNVERRRFSMPFFFNPRLDFCVERIDLPKSLAWERPRPEGSIECTSSHAGGNKLHACYGANAFKSLARSHPQVMERHHQDLIVSPDATIE
jgi:isopenicillin N synthase-like dioxygenase